MIENKVSPTSEIISCLILSDIEEYMLRNKVQCLCSRLNFLYMISRFSITCMCQNHRRYFVAFNFFFRFFRHFLQLDQNIFVLYYNNNNSTVFEELPASRGNLCYASSTKTVTIKSPSDASNSSNTLQLFLNYKYHVHHVITGKWMK
jgi:hypothetical protein